MGDCVVDGCPYTAQYCSKELEKARKQSAVGVLRVMRHQMKHLEDKKILTNEMNKLIKKAK